MPSPFPGMNPYLEQPAVWPDFHDGFIYRMRSLLTPLVRPKYYVRMQEQVYLHELPHPEARLIGRPDLTLSAAETEPATDGSVGVLESPARITLMEQQDEIRADALEIIDRADGHVVTAIELLSPSNKQHGSDRQQYLAKRRALLKAGVNFVELDLLRGGPRTIPSAPACDYLILVARSPELPEAGIWPLQLADPLPQIPIPLAAGDADPLLDLKAALDAVYDESGYEDYLFRTEPVPPLTGEQIEWASQYLRKP